MGIIKGMDGKNGIPTTVYPTKQIIHDPRQVKCPEELEVGKTYQEIHGEPNHSVDLVEIVSIGDEKITINSSKFQKSRKIYLADFGIIPYSKECWNHYNYLMPTN